MEWVGKKVPRCLATCGACKGGIAFEGLDIVIKNSAWRHTARAVAAQEVAARGVWMWLSM